MAKKRKKTASPKNQKEKKQPPAPEKGRGHTLHPLFSRRLFWFCAIILPFIVLAYYPSYQAFFNDYDIWFHLAYGKHYVENLTWHIDHSVYSWTPAIAKTPYITWIGSSVLYFVHKTVGVFGLFILQYAVLLATGAVVFRFAKTAGMQASLPVLTGILLTALTMGPAANHIKPEMFSILFVTLTAVFYLRFRMNPKPWIIAAFPLLFLIWVNTHGLWQFGIIFLGIVFAVDLILYAIRRFTPQWNQAIEGRALIYLSIAAVLTFLALCINPFGPAYPIGFIKSRFAAVIDIFFALKGSGDVLFAGALNPFGFVGDCFLPDFIRDGFSRNLSVFSAANGNGGSEILEHYRGVRAYLSLWEHLFYGQKQPFLTMTALGMAAMITSLLFAWSVSWERTGKADFPVTAANIAFFFMAMFMGRLALVFALIWLPSMIFLAWRAGPKPVFPRAGSPMALAAFIGLTVYVAVCATYIFEDRSWFGVGYEAYVPNKEIRYIMDNELPGPMFNDYLSGSYLIWTMYPEYRVSIDARHFPYRGQVFNDWAGIGTQYPINPKGLRDFTEKYPARIALVHHNYQNLIRWFERSPDWVLAYFDKAAVVMIHRNVIPALRPEAIGAMHPPSNYSDISNPILLGYIFDVYQRFFGIQFAAQIRDYYEQNVSDRYWKKQTTLINMDRFLERMKQQQGLRRR